MAYRDDDKLAFLAPLSRECTTRVITLKKTTGVLTITPTQLAAGYYQCRVPNGTSADTVTGTMKDAVTGIADTALDMPATNAAAQTLFAAPADAWFSMVIEEAFPFLAAVWDGAADSTLILMKVNFS